MKSTILKVALLTGCLGLATTGFARADCESDLVKLEAAFKTPSLSAEAKAALDAAKTKAVAALKKDDDKTCHQAIAEGMAKAGLKLE